MGRVRGAMGCLIINDIDAGAGTFKDTQMTVNTQMVMGTLMNICDDPNSVAVESIFGNRKNHVNRCPIIVTGNDFSKLYAPLLRDGRMEKYMWQPSEDDIVNILLQMFKEDGFTREEMLQFRRTLPAQALDFFGAVRASVADREVKSWVEDTIGGSYNELPAAACKAMGVRLLNRQLGPAIIDTDGVTIEDLLRGAAARAGAGARHGAQAVRGVYENSAGVGESHRASGVSLRLRAQMPRAKI